MKPTQPEPAVLRGPAPIPSAQQTALALMEDAVLARQQRSDAELRESEQRYRDLFEFGAVAIYACDAAGVIQHFNRGAAELWGREPAPGDTDERFCGSFKMYRPDGSFMPHAECPMAEVVSGKAAEVRDGEVRIERPDGSSVTVIVNIRPLKNERGEVTGAVNCFYDITARKRAEEQLRDSAAQYSDSDRRKTEFLGMLSHELRNPISAISNGLQVMRLSRGDPQAVLAVTAPMERQLSHLVGLVNDLLDVNRISHGKIELRRERIALSSVLTDAIEGARALCARMEHRLTASIPTEPIFLNADPLRLVQVFANLLNNACKFTGKEGEIRISAERDGEYAVVRVRDNGIGIGAKHLPLIFDVFMQADTSVERSVSGLGIGLALVKSLVEMHAGTVEAHSAGEGQGSEFVVRLPINREAMVRPEKPVNKPATSISRRILVVDDNRDTAESLAMLLKMAGNETRIAHDGLEAVEAAERFRPHVILLDIGLPKLNGYDAARRIREQPGGNEVVLIALTGWGQDEDRRKSRDSGFDRHMIKPLDLDGLSALLSQFPMAEGLRA